MREKLVVKSKFMYNRNKNTHSFKLSYYNRGNSKRLSVTYIGYPSKQSAERDCERLSEKIENTGKIKGFNPLILRERQGIKKPENPEGIKVYYLSY